MYWNKELETISRKNLEELQLKKLSGALRDAASTPFYRKVFKENNINVDKISSLDHLKDLPFTSKADLRLSYPDGMVAVPRSDIIRMHASSGTTGKSTVIFYTAKDISDWADLIARSMMATGTTRDDVFQNMMGYGLFTGGLGLHYGAERLGCMVIPASSGNSLKQIQLMQDFHTTVIHITPSYALHLGDVVAEQGVRPPDLGVKKAYLGAEPYSEETRNKIEEQWGLEAYNSYGLSEMNGPGVAFECEHRTGMHLWEDFYIPEIIRALPVPLKIDGPAWLYLQQSRIKRGKLLLDVTTQFKWKALIPCPLKIASARRKGFQSLVRLCLSARDVEVVELVVSSIGGISYKTRPVIQN